MRYATRYAMHHAAGCPAASSSTVAVAHMARRQRNLAVLLRKQRASVAYAIVRSNRISLAIIKETLPPVDGRVSMLLYRYPATTHLVWMERMASRYTRPRKEPQLGHAMCGSAGAPQFGQVTVWAALAFQFARREWVFAREVLYLGSAIVFPLFRSND